MADFDFRRFSIEEVYDFPVAITTFEDGGTEQRRLISNRELIGFQVKTPPMTQAQYQTFRAFFTARSGAFEAFTFTSPFDSTQHNVRFKEGSFRGRLRGGTYEAECQMVVINANEV